LVKIIFPLLIISNLNHKVKGKLEMDIMIFGDNVGKYKRAPPLTSSHHTSFIAVTELGLSDFHRRELLKSIETSTDSGQSRTQAELKLKLILVSNFTFSSIS